MAAIGRSLPNSNRSSADRDVRIVLRGQLAEAFDISGNYGRWRKKIVFASIETKD